MEKTATLNLRVNPTVKDRAERVLSQLGVPMSTAIDIYLNQISLTGGIPFFCFFAGSSHVDPCRCNDKRRNSSEIGKRLQRYSSRKSTKCRGSVCKI